MRQAVAFIEWAGNIELAEASLPILAIAEINVGIRNKSKDDPDQSAALSAWKAKLIAEFDGRILAFGMAEVKFCETIPSPSGRLTIDMMIAATAMANGLAVATRNEKDFIPRGVEVINPWEAGR